MLSNEECNNLKDTVAKIHNLKMEAIRDASGGEVSKKPRRNSQHHVPAHVE